MTRPDLAARTLCIWVKEGRGDDWHARACFTGILLMYRETKFVSASTIARRHRQGGTDRARTREARGVPNFAGGPWSRFGVQNSPELAFGVSLASKSVAAKSFVFIDGYP